MILLTLYVVLLFFHSLVSARLERTVLTAPIVFTLAGILVWLGLPGLRVLQGSPVVFLRVAEIGLVLLLFTDAARTDRDLLKSMRSLPARLLTTGMVLTLVLGALGALAVFPRFTLWEAGILAAILAPTDAGLGQVIVNSPRVPMKIRQALNVEAGLNDGLSVPFLLFFMGLAGASAEGGDPSLVRFIVEQLGYGVLVGAAVGLGGGWLLRLAQRGNAMAASCRQLAVVSLPLLCLTISPEVGASMFIAAFIAGLAVQVSYPEASKHSVEFTEDWGQLLNLSVFFLFGIFVAREWRSFAPAHLLYAVLSLTLVRMLPVAIALRGTHLSRATTVFMGWFGPRGLASIVLGLVFLEEATHQTDQATIRLAVMVTVLLSIFAHGLSALPGIDLYARKSANLGPDAPEKASVDPNDQ